MRHRFQSSDAHILLLRYPCAQLKATSAPRPRKFWKQQQQNHNSVEEDAREASIENVMELHLRNRAREEEAVAKVKVEPSEALKTEPSDDEEKILLDNFLGKQPPTELEDVQTKITRDRASRTMRL